MQYIMPFPNESGAYPAPQSAPFLGALAITDEQVAQLVAYNGFVILTVEDVVEPTNGDDTDLTVSSKVTDITPNIEAWEAWKASLPPETDPEPTMEEITLDLMAEHEERLCMLEILQ